MPGKRKQNFLGGAMILTVAIVLVKIIGALFKVPLTNILGGVGIGYFNTAYTIFTPIYTLAVSGLPIAVARMVAENAATGRYRDVRAIKRVSALAFITVGFVGFSLLFFGAKLFSGMAGMPGARYSLMAIAPTVFFCALMSIYRGYYQGLKNMVPTAVSQVIEAFIKMGVGILFSGYVLSYTNEQFETTGKIFGMAYESLQTAQVAMAQYAAAAAILAVSLSTVVGTIYLFLRDKLIGDGITPRQLDAAPRPRSRKVLLRRMVSIAIPICLGSIAVNLTSLIDLMSITRRIRTAMGTDLSTVLAMYQGLYPEGMPIEELPVHLYGSYTGIAVTIFNLVPALTTTLGVSSLPHVAEAWAAKNRAALGRNVESVLRISFLIAIPAGLGIAAMAEPIVTLLYPLRAMEGAIAIPLLRVLGLAVIFVGVLSPVNSVLQAIGRVDVPVKLITMGGLLKLGMNYVLVTIPSINIQAAPYGTLLCYGLVTLLSLYVLTANARIKLDKGIFLKPLLGGILCAAMAYLLYSPALLVLPQKIATLVCIGAGGIVYAATLLLTRAITKTEILMLPGGEKIAKTLEKHGLIR